MMAYNTQNYWVSGLCQSSRTLNTRKQCFENWIYFSSCEEREKPTLLGPLERADLQFPKRCVFWYVDFRMMDEVQKPSNSLIVALQVSFSFPERRMFILSRMYIICFLSAFIST
jgi:hypothetical protein